MPALIKTGPKLPSFQKLKNRKRPSEEDPSNLPGAPKAKRPSFTSSASEDGAHTASLESGNKIIHKKVKKAIEWKQKMAKEKEERLKKSTKDRSTAASGRTEKIKPGENWKKLQTTMTHLKTTISKTNEKIAEDLPRNNLNREEGEAAEKVTGTKQKALRPAGWNPANHEDTLIVAIDCEMVGVGLEGKSHSLARVVIVNYYGGLLLDRFVQQIEAVVDTRTHVSGVRRKHLKNGVPFKQVQQEVFELLRDKIVVGHQLSSDFKVLMLDHPKLYTRDTARYGPLQKAPGKPHSLKHLGAEILDLHIQDGSHNPIEDARTALLIYRHIQKNWEASIKSHVKSPSVTNPITKIIEKANRTALAAPPIKTKDPQQSSSRTKSTKRVASEVDSWASSSESESDSSTDNSSEYTSGDVSGSE